jgi:hypothetical protein
MTGSHPLRDQEYAALTSRARDIARTSALCWTGAGLAASFLLASAISSKHPGLLLPVQFCVGFGFHVYAQARREAKLIEGYIQEYFEKDREGAQWHTRLAQLQAVPGGPARTDWWPVAAGGSLAAVAILFSWLFAEGVSRGELLASLTTMSGVAVIVHALAQTLDHERGIASVPWSAIQNASLREVPTIKRVSTV